MIKPQSQEQLKAQETADQLQISQFISPISRVNPGVAMQETIQAQSRRTDFLLQFFEKNQKREIPTILNGFWNNYGSTQPLKTQNMLRRHFYLKVDERHQQTLNDMMFTKMTATRESENEKIRQDLTLKRIWRLVRDFYQAEISSQIQFKSRKCYREKERNYIQICDEFVAKNFDQRVFQNLGHGIREEVAEVLVAIVDPPGLQQYLNSVQDESLTQQKNLNSTTQTDPILVFKKAIQDVREETNLEVNDDIEASIIYRLNVCQHSSRMKRIAKVKNLCKDIGPFRANFKKKMFPKQLHSQSFVLVLEYCLSQLAQSHDFDHENFESQLLAFENPTHFLGSRIDTSRVFSDDVDTSRSLGKPNKRQLKQLEKKQARSNLTELSQKSKELKKNFCETVMIMHLACQSVLCDKQGLQN